MQGNIRHLLDAKWSGFLIFLSYTLVRKASGTVWNRYYS
jgi:hypothetical protein